MYPNNSSWQFWKQPLPASTPASFTASYLIFRFTKAISATRRSREEPFFWCCLIWRDPAHARHLKVQQVDAISIKAFWLFFFHSLDLSPNLVAVCLSRPVMLDRQWVLHICVYAYAAELTVEVIVEVTDIVSIRGCCNRCHLANQTAWRGSSKSNRA